MNYGNMSTLVGFLTLKARRCTDNSQGRQTPSLDVENAHIHM